ncbi:MAG: hypothetical protein JWQ88_3206, partial [Rhodoferax sp.]|nr:hypothetical protein [Rhodoferax sp.]
MNPLLDEAGLATRIRDYLRRETGRPVTVGTVRRFPVGFSWLTFAVPVDGLDDAGARELILRLGPDYGLFAPYTAGPQVMAMQSLEGSAVPVPRVYWNSDDPSILGAPFLFCEKVAGSTIVPWVSPNEPQLPDDYRKAIGTQFIDALAALHAVDWRDRPMAAMAHGITA